MKHDYNKDEVNDPFPFENQPVEQTDSAEQIDPDDPTFMPTGMRWLVAAAIGFVMLVATVIVWLSDYSWKVNAIFVVVWIVILLVILRIVRGSVDDADARADAILECPVEPSKRARKTMTKTESLWIEARQHPMRLFWWYVMALVLFVVTSHWPTTMLLSWLIILVVLGVRMLLWAHLHNCFSDWRVFRLGGLVSIKVNQMAYSKMTDTKYKIPWHSRLLAWLRIIRVPYGTLTLESPGQEQALTRLTWVQNIEALWRHMSELTRETTE